MINELRELLQLIEKLPSMVMWVLGGFLLYKLVITGSIWATVRLLINKTHNYFTMKKVEAQEESKITKIQIGDLFITSDASASRFVSLLHSLRDTNGGGYASSYVHLSDIRWLEGAVYDKREKEREEKKAREAKP
jgi:hypothetical protein